MSFFKRLLGRETPEEKAKREEEERLKEEKEKEEKAAKQLKKEREEYARKNNGAEMPVQTSLTTGSGGPPIALGGLSHEQQMKQEAMAAQAALQAAAAQAALATPQQSEETPLAQLALASHQQQQQQYPQVAGEPATSSSSAVPSGPKWRCEDCQTLDAVVYCNDCAAGLASKDPAQFDSVRFCAECDTAFHRGKRAGHNRIDIKCLPPPPMPQQVNQPTATTSTTVAAPIPAPTPATPATSSTTGGAQPVNPNNSPFVKAVQFTQGMPPVDVGQTVPASIIQSINNPSSIPSATLDSSSQPPPATVNANQPTSFAPGPSNPSSSDPGAAPTSLGGNPSNQPTVQPIHDLSAQPPTQPQQPLQPVAQTLPTVPDQQLNELQPGIQPQVQSIDLNAPQQPIQSNPQQPQRQQQLPLQPQQQDYQQQQQYQASQQPQQPTYIPQEPQQQQQYADQQQQQQQRPVIPPVPLQLVQQQQPSDTTPRNPDGSVNFDARHRHTPRSPRDQIADTTPANVPQQPKHVGLLDNNTDVKDLHPEEIAELRIMFDKFDINRDEHLALDEVSRFLAELEFTYSESFIQFLIDHIFGLHIHQRESVGPNKVRSIKGQLTFDEFLEFMRVFYWLHDHVCSEIERQFLHAFKKPVDDECIAILCRLVRFNDQTELDFNEMNLRLVEAVNDEAMRAQEQQRQQDGTNWSAQVEASPFLSPLAQQHLVQQQRENDLAQAEFQRKQDARQAEYDEIRQRQLREDEEKMRLLQQREQFRAQAIQQQQFQHQQQLSPVNEYPDANEDQRIRRSQPTDEDDPFAAHGGSANDIQPKTPIQLRMDMATRLAASLDQSDEEYIKRSWTLLLKHFDPDRTGGISAKDIGQAFRAMGLDPSTAQLNEFFIKADLDRSGTVDYQEFKSYYSELYNQYLRKGLELGQVKRIFRTFDEDGDGRVSIAEFRHVVKQICPSDIELSTSDVERLCKLADVNGDGEVDFKEFLDLIRLSTTDTPASGSLSPGSPQLQHAYGDSPEVLRHEQMMAFRAARALTRKIIRAHMPSPMEHIMAYSHMPSTFRPSMLARYQSREEFFPSSILNPVLNESGMHYQQMQMDPRTKQLRPCPLNSNTGMPDLNYVGYFIELEYASGIPLPDVAHRTDIVARRCRICILEGTKPLSNLYMAKAEWDASEEDRWKFQLKFQENEWNAFVFKTTAKQCTILFELTCLVKKQGEANKDGSRRDLPQSESSYVEMSCGFATLDLDLATPLIKETSLQCGIMGGNMEQVELIKDSEILARRSGWRAVTQLFTGPVKSQLCFKISPTRLKEERPVNYLRFLPCHLILSWSTVEVVKLFYEILAAFILLPQFQPLQIGKSCQLSIQLFLKYIVDVPDLLQVLAEVWSEQRKSIKRVALRDHDSGAICHAPSPNDHLDTSSAFMMDRFRECIMKLYPAISMAQGVLPPLIVGITDLKRLSLLRLLVHTDDTLRILTNDGMMRAGTTGAGGSSGITRAPLSLARATSVQNLKADAAAAQNAPLSNFSNPGINRRSSLGSESQDAFNMDRGQSPADPYSGSVEFKNIFAPFHTNEISFDPNAHSEDHHFERRSHIAFEIQSAGFPEQ